MTDYFIDFPNFDAASKFASWAASPFGFDHGEIPIHRAGNKFQVGIPWPLTLDMACKYIYNRCRGFTSTPPGPDIIAVLDPTLSVEMRSPALTWTDPLSRLTWDVARYFMRTPHDEHPDKSADLMNAVCYGGFKDWRLPTPEEIKTLGNERYLNLALLTKEELVRYRQWIIDAAASKHNIEFRPSMLNIWSSEVGGESDDYVGINLHNLERFWQQYSEEDRSYRHWGRTLMVRGGSE